MAFPAYPSTIGMNHVVAEFELSFGAGSWPKPWEMNSMNARIMCVPQPPDKTRISLNMIRRTGPAFDITAPPAVVATKKAVTVAVEEAYA